MAGFATILSTGLLGALVIFGSANSTEGTSAEKPKAGDPTGVAVVFQRPDRPLLTPISPPRLAPTQQAAKAMAKTARPGLPAAAVIPAPQETAATRISSPKSTNRHEKPSMPDRPEPLSRPKEAKTPAPPVFPVKLSEDQLCHLLLEVPELRLDQSKDRREDLHQSLSQGFNKGARAQELQLARARNKELAALHGSDPKNLDAFLDYLEKNRPDLADLPFRIGKECVLEGSQAKEFGGLSRGIRSALSTATLHPTGGLPNVASPSFGGPDPTVFWNHLHMAPSRLESDLGLRALQQLLMAEQPGLRFALVKKLAELKGKGSSRALARRAIFDLHPTNRQVALAALKDRPGTDYVEELVEALRHPWAPAAVHAAEALVVLKRKEAIPQLARLLEEPDPSAPFPMAIDGKKVMVMRELVRVNHFRNCLLCHPPTQEKTLVVGGVVPVTAMPLPPSTSTAYYAGRRGEVVVRADVTFLRQDFSVPLPVKDPGRWPAVQRFDFLIRTRALTDVEQTEWQIRKAWPAGQEKSPHKMALLFALASLNGENLGDSAKDWSYWARLAGNPARPSVSPCWKSPCLR
jgi:hypothetical protein